MSIVTTVTRPFDEVLDAAKDGEAWAWQEIFNTYADPVAGYVALRGASDPEDITSETLYHVARSIHRFEGSESSFRSWVFVIAHRKLIDARRAANRRVEQTEFSDDLQERGENVEAAAIDRVALAEMQSLIAQLTDAQQEVISLRLIADMSVAETARVMGKNVGSIKALQRRALQSLRRQIESQRVSK